MSCGQPNSSSACRPRARSGARSMGATPSPNCLPVTRPQRNVQGRTVPETRFSAVPFTSSTIISPPADGSRVNSTPAYSAASMRCTRTLPAPPVAAYDFTRAASNDAWTLPIAASSPSRSTLSTDLEYARETVIGAVLAACGAAHGEPLAGKTIAKADRGLRGVRRGAYSGELHQKPRRQQQTIRAPAGRQRAFAPTDRPCCRGQPGFARHPSE